jgi:hypothetical protein
MRPPSCARRTRTWPADYRRRIAALERRLKALEDRAFVDELLNATVGETPAEKDAGMA